MKRFFATVLAFVCLFAVPSGHAVRLGPAIFAGQPVKCDMRVNMFNVGTDDEATLGYVLQSVTFVGVVGHVIGTAPSVDFNINNLASRSGTPGAQNKLFVSDETVNSSFGVSFDQSDFNPNSTTTAAFRSIWVTVSAVSGTVDEFHLTVCYTGGGW